MKNIFIKWSPVFILSLALAIIIIDGTLLNVSISTIIEDLNTDIQSIQWVITAYSLTLAALTITGGRLGDLFGRKKMFLLGVIIFATGSFVASISQNIQQLVIGWSIIEGIGAALMMPATASLLVSTYKTKKERAIAFGVWGGVAAASSAVGPILGGFLTTNYSWRWGFRLNIFVALIFIAGSFLIKESKERKKPELDYIGVFLSSLGLASLVYGIIESSKYGWFKTDMPIDLLGKSYNLGGYSITVYAVIVGLLLLTLFAFWERGYEKKGHMPLVSLSIFNNRQFTAGMVTMGIVALGQAGLIFSIPIFVQSVRGLDAFNTGLVLLPMSLAAFITAPLSGMVLVKFIKPKILIQLGLVSTFVGYYLLQSTISVNTASSDMALGLVFLGVGMGLVMAQISNLTLSAISVDKAGEASGVNNTFRQVGATLGTAVIGAVLLTTLTTSFEDGINGSSILPDVAKKPIIEKIAENSSSIEFGSNRVDSSVPTMVAEEITQISHQAVTDSSKVALRYAAFFTLMGLLASTQLPKEQKNEI